MLRRLIQQRGIVFNASTSNNCSGQLAKGLLNQHKKSYSSINKRDISIVNYDSNSFTAEQLSYINQVQNLKYNELVSECKNLKLKPKDRTRSSLIQAIIKSIPAKGEEVSSSQNDKNGEVSDSIDLNSTSVRSPQVKEEYKLGVGEHDPRIVNSPHREAQIEDIKKAMKGMLSKEEYQRLVQQLNFGTGEYPNKSIEIDTVVQLRKAFDESTILSEYDEYVLQYIEPKATQSVYYLENYSFEQMQKHVEDMPPMSISKEIALLINRSNFINECDKSYALKVKSSKHEQSRHMLSQILCIENEYCSIFQDEAKQFLKEISNSRIVNSSVLHITKTLSDPIQFWHYASLFKWGSPSSLISLWKTLTLSIDFYDIDNIQTLTRCLYMIRKYSRFYPQNNQNNQEEIQFYEKLTTVIHQIISEKESQVSYYYIANILGYLKQINVPFTNKTLKNLQSIAEIFIDIYRQDLEQQSLRLSGNSNDEMNYMVTPEVLDNTTPDFFLRILFALSYYPSPPQIIINDVYKKLVDAGLEFFEKNVVVKILSQLMLSNIPINESVAEAIRKNKKIIYDLSIREIYVFIYSFKDSNQDMGKLYHHFYFQTGLFLDNVTILNDFKQVVMVAKIHYYILTSKINEHKRVYVEKRTNQVLNLINKSCTDAICRDYIADIIYISSLFIPYLNKPDFLFSKIIKNIQFLKVNSDNRPLFTNFIMKTIEKLNPHFDFFVNHQNMDLEFNDKLNIEIKTLLNVMIKKFIECKLLSFFLLTIQICAAPNLLKQVVFHDNERHELTKNLTLQIIKILGHENNKFGFANLVMFSNFIDTNLESIRDETIIIKAQHLIFESFKKINQKPNENEDLLWIYYHSNILSKVSVSTVEEKKNLNEYFLKKVVKPICENQIGVVNQIIHEDGIVQYFNNNVNYSNLQNIIYLPSILRNLGVDINKQPSIQQYLIPKIMKESKYWNGAHLINNLLTLNKLKINCFELFENVAENLLTSLVYYSTSQSFEINQEIYSSKEKVVELLDAYAEQYRNHVQLNPSYEMTKHKNFMVLNILASFVLKQLSPSTLSSIFDLMGHNQQLYFKPFLTQVSQASFNLSDNELLEFYYKLPSWIKNRDLAFKIDLKIKQNLKIMENSELEYCLKYYTKEMLFNDDVTEQFINRLFHDTDAKYFERLLEYLSIGEVISNDSQYEIIEKYYLKYYDSLSPESHLNMVQVFTLYQIMHEKPLVLPKSFPLNAPSFYKFVNKFLLDGKEYEIPYQESFTLQHESYIPQYKIYPRYTKEEESDSSSEQNDSGEEQQEASAADKKAELQNSGLINEEISSKIYEYIKQICYVNSTPSKQQSKYINRYYLYHLIAKKRLNETTYAEEERLNTEFKAYQKEQQTLLKQNEDYSNFLIDFQTVINNNVDATNYEINYSGEDTQHLTVNIAVRFNSSSKKVGFFFVNDALTKVGGINQNREYVLSGLTRMKIDLLEKHHGWTIYPIYYEKWAQTFNTGDAKEQFILKALNLQNSN